MEQVELCLDGPAMAGKVVPIEKEGFVNKCEYKVYIFGAKIQMHIHAHQFSSPFKAAKSSGSQ